MCLGTRTAGLEVEGGDHFLNICAGRRTRLETAMKIALCMSARIG